MNNTKVEIPTDYKHIIYRRQIRNLIKEAEKLMPAARSLNRVRPLQRVINELKLAEHEKG